MDGHTVVETTTITMALEDGAYQDTDQPPTYAYFAETAASQKSGEHLPREVYELWFPLLERVDRAGKVTVLFPGDIHKLANQAAADIAQAFPSIQVLGKMAMAQIIKATMRQTAKEPVSPEEAHKIMVEEFARVFQFDLGQLTKALETWQTQESFSALQGYEKNLLGFVRAAFDHMLPLFNWETPKRTI